MSPSIGDLHRQVLELVDAGSTLEEMAHALKLDSQAVAAELLRLELDGLLLAQPGTALETALGLSDGLPPLFR